MLRIHIISAVATLLVVLGLAAADARAAEFCVQDGACENPRNTLQEALDDAEAEPGPDTVRVGPGEHVTSTGFHYTAGDEANDLILSGHGPDTVLRADTATKSGVFRVLSVIGGAKERTDVSDLTIVAPGRSEFSNDIAGLATANATVHDVAIGHGGASPDSALVLGSGAEAGDMDLDAGTGAAVRVTGTAVLGDSTLKGRIGVWSSSKQALPWAGRLDIQATGTGVLAEGGLVQLTDVGIRLLAPGAIAIHADDSGGANTHVLAAQVTVRGGGHTDTIGVFVHAKAHEAHVTVNECILEGVTLAAYLQAPAPTSVVAMTRCNYPDNVQGTGAGTFKSTDVTHLAPKFAGPETFALAPGSPMIDAGSSPDVGPQSLDLLKQPRVVDGDGDGTAAVDLGAIEYQPAPKPPTDGEQPDGSVPPDGGGPEGSTETTSDPLRDLTAPVISRLRVRKRQGRLSLSETARLTIAVQRRKGGRWRRVATKKAYRGAGAATIRLGRLRSGRYRLAVVAVDAAGNRSSVARARFRVR